MKRGVIVALCFAVSICWSADAEACIFSRRQCRQSSRSCYSQNSRCRTVTSCQSYTVCQPSCYPMGVDACCGAEAPTEYKYPVENNSDVQQMQTKIRQLEKRIESLEGKVQ